MATARVKESTTANSSDPTKSNRPATMAPKASQMVVLPPPASWLHNEKKNDCDMSDSNDDPCDSTSIGNEGDRKKSSHDDVVDDNNVENGLSDSGNNAESLNIKQETHPDKEALLFPPASVKISISKSSPSHLPLTNDYMKRMSSKVLVGMQVIPDAARELMSVTARKACYHTRLSYVTSSFFGKQSLRNSEVGSNLAGYHRDRLLNEGIRDEETGEVFFSSSKKKRDGKNANGFVWEDEWDKARAALPPFSSLRWIDRQLVKEWRTYDYSTLPSSSRREKKNEANPKSKEEDDSFEDDDSTADQFLEEVEFERARTLVPQPLPRPPWENSTSCYACRKSFCPTLLRHHCRLCGRSYCHSHSQWQHKLPHLGYDQDVPERVCTPCKRMLDSQNLMERITWRMARCRDYFGQDLVPYFDMNVDTVEDKTVRLTRAALHMARSIPLGAQATVAVETLDIIRKHGIKGFYGIILRREFMAAADLLCKVTGINKKSWPLSVHELSVAVFYALAQHRAVRGAYPEREHLIHSFREKKDEIESAVIDSLEESGGFVADRLTVTIEEGNDEIVGGCTENKIKFNNKNMLIDLNDRYDPMAEKVIGLLAGEGKDLQEETSIPGCKIKELHGDIDCGSTGSLDRSEELNSDIRNANNWEGRKDNAMNNLPFTPVCDPVPDSILASLIFYAPLAVNFVYAENEVDMQLLAAQQGWRLIYSHLQQEETYVGDRQVAEMPASALFVHRERKIACFAVRGTATMNDVVTDIRQAPVQFPDPAVEQLNGVASESIISEEGWTEILEGQGLALCGMTSAAYNLFRENIDALLLFARKGYQIRLTGHSMGGSVAALMGLLVQHHFEWKIRQGDELGKLFGSKIEHQQPLGLDCVDESILTRNNLLKVYGYGSPACVDAKLSGLVQPYVITVVLHDDVVPRLTPTSIRGLLKHLLYIRETWVKSHLANDLMAITERAKTAWAPKVRSGFSLLSAKTSSFKAYGMKLKFKRKLQNKKVTKVKVKLNDESCDHSNFRIHTKNKETDNALLLTDDHSEPEYEQTSIDGALYYEGDCFYEAGGSLIEHSDDEDSDDEIDMLSETMQKKPILGDDNSLQEANTEKETSEETGTKYYPSAVLLEETPLPRMFIPGKIIHIYTHRGGYKAAFVPRAFRELRRISLAGNMINDHTAKSYFEALLECKSIRRANEECPEWTGYNEETTCSCCASKFTWASTSDSEAQEARDKHNCRSCGSLVCDPCSRNRVPIPCIGITIPSRVCDKCYNDGLTNMGEISLTESFVVGSDNDMNSVEFSDLHRGELNRSIANKPVKGRLKRNLVVDELASRVNSSTFCI